MRLSSILTNILIKKESEGKINNEEQIAIEYFEKLMKVAKDNGMSTVVDIKGKYEAGKLRKSLKISYFRNYLF